MTYHNSIILSASEDRLAKLIRERFAPDADKEKIDARIWDLFGEDWCIMFTDLSGFSRNVARFGIIHFLQTIYESERLLVPIIDAYDGILLKLDGDSFLVIFRNVQKAIDASLAMQAVLRDYNQTKLPEEKVLLCIGLGYGRVLRIGDKDVFGEEVNFASKLGEDVAQSGEVLVTEAVRARYSGSAEINLEPLETVPSGMVRAYKLCALKE